MVRVAGVTNSAVAPDRLWAVLDDPARLAEALPQVSDFEAAPDGTSFRTDLHPATALGEVPMTATWERRARDPGRSLSYALEGRGEEHALALGVRLELAERDGEAIVRWEVECAVTGVMASVTQRVLGAVVAHQVEVALAAVARVAAA